MASSAARRGFHPLVDSGDDAEVEKPGSRATSGQRLWTVCGACCLLLAILTTCCAAWLFLLDRERTEEECPRNLQRQAEMYLTAKMAQSALIDDENEFLRNRSLHQPVNLDALRAGPGGQSYGTPPTGVSRAHTFYGFCDCSAGQNSATFWAEGDMENSRVTVEVADARWIRFEKPVTNIHWFCDGMDFWQQVPVNLKANQWLSVQVASTTCQHAKPAGLVHFNTWDEVSYTSSVPFTSGTDGYFCFKIPAMLRTANGTFIAFSEARKPDCSDFAATDLVFKRSVDGGKTWGPLQVMVRVPEDQRMSRGLCGKPLVVGNVAPVQLRLDSAHHPGRILAPYTRNNFKQWLVHSDDDGVTWTNDHELEGLTEIEEGVDYADAKPDCNRCMSYFGYDVDRLDMGNVKDLVRFVSFVCYRSNSPHKKPEWRSKLSGPWQFVGLGPPNSIQLSKTGRVLVPGYHSYVRGLEGDGTLPISQLYNNLALGHVLISDDGGDTWRLGEDWPVGEGANEHDLVELADGSVLSNTRALATGSPQWRLQAKSTDGGVHFSETATTEIPQPFNGCQGSAISGGNDTVYVSGPDPEPAKSWLQDVVKMLWCDVQLTGRSRVSLWKSTDGGRSYPEKRLVDPGLSAQTSLVYHDGKVYLLYEQADPAPASTLQDKILGLALENLRVLLPSRFVFREVPP